MRSDAGTLINLGIMEVVYKKKSDYRSSPWLKKVKTPDVTLVEQKVICHGSGLQPMVAKSMPLSMLLHCFCLLFLCF